MASDNTTEQEPIINIRGMRVGLGPRDPSIVEAMYRLGNTFTTRRTLSDPRPITRAETESWLFRPPEANEVVFAIYNFDYMAFIGDCGLFEINHRHQTCALRIAIFDPDRRGRGLGTEAVQLLTDYAIHGLEMHNVDLRVSDYNWAGRRAYAKAGFKEYGRRRAARLYQGRRWDVIFMEVVATEWDSPVMKALMTPDEKR